MFKRIVCSLLVGCIVLGAMFSGICVFADKTKSNKVDIVFMIDTSKAFENRLQPVLSSIRKTISDFEKNGVDYRVAVIEFRDAQSRTTDLNDYAYKTSGFMTGYDIISSYLDTVTLSFKVNPNSCLLTAIIDGTKNLAFRYDAIRSFFIFGVTPCYNPEPDTGYDLLYVINELSLNENNTASCPYKFYTYNFGNEYDCFYYYNALSNYSGGRYSDITNSIIDVSSSLDTELSTDIYTILYGLDVVYTEKTIDDKVSEILENVPLALKPLVKLILRVYVAIYKILYNK